MVGGMVFGKHVEQDGIRLNVAGTGHDEGQYLYTVVVDNEDSKAIQLKNGGNPVSSGAGGTPQLIDFIYI